MTHPTAVLNVVGLNQSLLSEAPNLCRLVERGRLVRLDPVLPAVTCSVQTSMITGLPPREHGIVGNGWYHRDLAEVRFWHRSHRLIEGEPVWETARRRDPDLTCANLFWWYNAYSTSDLILQVRPMYKADGRKLPDCYSDPPELRDELQGELGQFPLFRFWGPAADIRSSRWIADAALSLHRKHQPTLTLVYLPHLDYPLQKYGPEAPQIAPAVREIDAEVGRLVEYFGSQNVRTLIVSEYGIEAVNDAVPINKRLREAGLIRVRDEQGLEQLDAGASRAFAVADHQVAHVYVQHEADVAQVAALCRTVPGVDQVLDRAAQAAVGLDHPRAGELVLVAEHRRWFSYDYWLDDRRAPDFARTVDIHRKPGYDPRELFIDPAFRVPALAVASRVLRKKLGLRTLLDIVPLDTQLVRGSHGRPDLPPAMQPVMILPDADAGPDVARCQAVRDVILSCLFDERVGLPEAPTANGTRPAGVD